MKDPAFLFYSKDFYEGTRTMLPEERACYVDLLIYQHQNGIIPDDDKRLLLYCSGISKSVLHEVLKSKFTNTEDGWINDRLNTEMIARQNYKSSLSSSGKIGQFWKKAKKLLSRTEYNILKKYLDRDELENEIDEIDLLDEGSLIGSLKHRLSIIANANANEDIDIDIDKEKGGVGEKEKTEKEKEYDRFNEWVDKTIPELRKIKKQITFSEYCILTQKYNGEQIRKILTDMANYKKAPTQYTSVNITFQKWAKKEYG